MGRAAVIIALAVALALGSAWVVGGPEVAGLPAPVWLAALSLGVNGLAFVPAAAYQTERYYDLTGSVTYWLVTLAALGLAVTADTLSVVSLGAAAAVLVWAGRLGSFLFARVKRDGRDGRFDAIKVSPPRFAVAWTLQGLWVFWTSLAATTLIVTGPPVTLAVGIGGLLWVTGFAIEVIADTQKRRFNENQTGSRRWIDTGLWRWSRHPNYFGEIVLWTGVFVAGLQTWSGGQWGTVLSPVFSALLLTRVSGIPMVEQRADERWGDDPEYQAYKARTPALIPRPPRG